MMFKSIVKRGASDGIISKEKEEHLKSHLKEIKETIEEIKEKVEGKKDGNEATPAAKDCSCMTDN